MTAEPIPAAAILLVAGDRVLVGERSNVPFLSGFVAFPGGRVEDADRGEKLDAHRTAALRELAEETGVLLAGGGISRNIPPALRDGPMREIYSGLGLQPPEASELVFAGRWVTPDSAAIRFDTHFFLATTVEAPELAPSKEFAWAKFISAGELLAAWRRFEILLSPPTKHALEVLAVGTKDAARRLTAVPEAAGELSIEAEPVSGIRVLPLRTPTLPPARHTNTYLVGEERFVVIDPATYETDERDKLRDRIEARVNGGAKFEAVILTHHHADHTGAAMWLKEELGAPIWAHRITRDLVAPEIEVDRLLEEGDRIALGGGFELEVFHTPGHAPGHIVLADRRPGGRAMIVGDMVAGIGTIIIDPPEGDMAIYLEQLRRMRAMPNAILFPAHGPPQVDGHAKLDEYVKHRLMREDKVVQALAVHKGPARPKDLLDVAYADTPPALFPLAARSCLAHLEKLVKDGRAIRHGDRFEQAR